MEAKDTGWSTEREEDGMASKAEIFEAGRRAGIREVADFVTSRRLPSMKGLVAILEIDWQAKLKEWGREGASTIAPNY